MGHTKNLLGRNDSSIHTPNGREVCSPIPAHTIVENNGSDSELERFRSIIRNEMSLKASESGFETFQEANNFDIEDDFEEFPDSKYMKEEFLQPVVPHMDKDAPPDAEQSADGGGRPNATQEAPEKEPEE